MSVKSIVKKISSSEFIARDLRAAIGPWIFSRVIVGLALLVARTVSSGVDGIGDSRAAHEGLFVYDGSLYRGIAEVGYEHLPRELLRFFPLYPLSGRALGWAFFGHIDLALLVIANGGALIAGALLFRLVLRETSDERLATRSVWFLAIFPASLVLVLAYAESILLVAAIGMFLALRSKRWWLAAALGLAAGATRPVGLLLALPALIEATRDFSSVTNIKERIARAASVVAPVVGVGAYLVWVDSVFGGFFTAFDVQSKSNLRGSTTDPFTRVGQAIADTFGADIVQSSGRALRYLIWIALALILIGVVSRRLPSSYTAYGLVAIVLGMTSENSSSFERYTFTTFPLIIGLAYLTETQRVRGLFSIISIMGLFSLSLAVFLGQYVP